MQLKKLLKNVEFLKVIGNKNIKIKNICLNHNEVKKGDLFFCLKGQNFNGHNFAKNAIEQGASCLVVEEYLNLPIKATQVVVKDTRCAMSLMAKNFYGSMCDKLKIVSVVGTNGKTTITYILNEILKKQGKKVAIIGTTGTIVNDKNIESKLTTPDPIDLHYIFKQLYNLKVDIVLVEVSAQAIFYKKMKGVTSEIAIFTNCTNEHLDFFKTMENYKGVKSSYFSDYKIKNSVINIDDELGLQIYNNNKKQNHFSYGIFNPAKTFAMNVSTSLMGSKFLLNCKDEIFDVSTPLIGIYNVYNVLASINAAVLLGCELGEIVKSLKDIDYIPGRFNIYNLHNNNKAVIDYAHSPDSFEKILSTIKQLRKGKIITVFGCVGYSDSLKRKSMGGIASKFSDFIVLTSDNPNYVDINKINSNIKSGFIAGYDKFSEVSDRKLAIEEGFLKLTKNDTLVILGKGMEKTNKINGKDIECNDLSSLISVMDKLKIISQIEV